MVAAAAGACSSRGADADADARGDEACRARSAHARSWSSEQAWSSVVLQSALMTGIPSSLVLLLLFRILQAKM